jgi:hypothetical protein
MKNVRLIEVHTENVLPIEEGSILKYIAAEYDIVKQNYGSVFQVIGNPADEYDNTEVEYTFSTDKAPYKTHIKVI